MQIDWFTLIAQVVNFLILVVVLRALLYKRIIKAMDEREARIAEKISSAEEKEARAEEIQKEFKNKRDEIDKKRDSIIAEAREDANQKANEIMAKAREEVEQKKEEWLAALRKDKENFVKKLNRKATDRVLTTARKILREMADEGLNSRIVHKFSSRLEGLTDDDIEEFRNALKDEGGEMTIVSAFELDDDEMSSLISSIKDRFGAVEATSKVASEKIAGVELRAGGKKLEWSIEEYIDELQEGIRVAFEQMTAETKKKSEEMPETNEKSEVESETGKKTEDHHPQKPEANVEKDNE